VAGAERRIACEGKLLLRRQDANAVVGRAVGRTQQKCRFAQVPPIGKCRHLGIGEPIGANDNGQRMAAQRLRGEHIDLMKIETGHVV
jgi:hypothetical protein